MPLPGGPSDKAGNGYELLWTVRTMLDVLTGRYESIRIEVPGIDSAEFVCCHRGGSSWHQVKRGNAKYGKWTARMLAEVLSGFQELLTKSNQTQCVFVSEHAASDLAELTDRARSAVSLSEFEEKFLSAKKIKSAWQETKEIWSADSSTCFDLLKRIKFTTVGSAYLREDINQILRLMFDRKPDIVRALLSQIATESIHLTIKKETIVNKLAEEGIFERPKAPLGSSSVTSVARPPEPQGLKRSPLIDEIRQAIANECRTVLVGGIAGIGKSTICAQFASTWNGPVCWLDCDLFSTNSEIFAFLKDFCCDALGRTRPVEETPGQKRQTLASYRAIGRILDDAGTLVVWDGVDHAEDITSPFISSFSGTMSSGAQIITGRAPSHAVGELAHSSICVPPLSTADARKLIFDAFPNATLGDLTSAINVTYRHPFLIRLLTASSPLVDLRTALSLVKEGSEEDKYRGLLKEAIANLPRQAKNVLELVAHLGVPFRTDSLHLVGAKANDLRQLALRFLVVRTSSNSYVVPPVLRELLGRVHSTAKTKALHERAALFLAAAPDPNWLDIRALLNHASKAEMWKLATTAAESLLMAAEREGRWDLLREAATSLVSAEQTSHIAYPHYILGKSLRMRGLLDDALEAYKTSEDLSQVKDLSHAARSEQASVLTELGRVEEALSIYKHLSETGATALIKADALTSMMLIEGRAGDLHFAERMFDKIIKIEANDIELAKINAYQVMGTLYAESEHWPKSREFLKKAFELRHEFQGEPNPHAVYGWYHLYKSIAEVEKNLGNEHQYRCAVRGLWRFAAISDSLQWEYDAAFALASTLNDAKDPEVGLAIRRLALLGRDTDLQNDVRRDALEALVLTSWASGAMETALEGILDLLALATDADLAVPLFLHQEAKKDSDEPGNVQSVAEHMHVLYLPKGTSRDTIRRMVTEIIDRRPELAQYPALLEISEGSD